MHRELVCSIVGYEQDGRVMELIKTLRNCKRVGLSPRIFLSSPPAGKEQSRINQKRARDWAIKKESDLIFLEDDLIFNDKLFEYFLDVTLREYKNDVVFFYSHDTAQDFHFLYDKDMLSLVKNPSKKISNQFYKFISYERLHFGQAVYIPLRVLKLMSGTLKQYYKKNRELLPTDALLSLTLTKKPVGWEGNVNAFVTLPHPIQHTHARNGRENENEGRDTQKRSLSFERGIDNIRDSWYTFL